MPKRNANAFMVDNTKADYLSKEAFRREGKEMRTMGKRKPKPTKVEIARMKVLSDTGVSEYSIGKALDRSNHTVNKYLNDQEALADPMVKELVEKIKKTEADDLRLIGLKARRRIHELLDAGDSQLIPTVATMDRAFQQRRLIEGQATEIIDYGAVSKELAEVEKKLREYEEQKARTINVTPQRKEPSE